MNDDQTLLVNEKDQVVRFSNSTNSTNTTNDSNAATAVIVAAIAAATADLTHDDDASTTTTTSTTANVTTSENTSNLNNSSLEAVAAAAAAAAATTAVALSPSPSSSSSASFESEEHQHHKASTINETNSINNNFGDGESENENDAGAAGSTTTNNAHQQQQLLDSSPTTTPTSSRRQRKKFVANSNSSEKKNQSSTSNEKSSSSSSVLEIGKNNQNETSELDNNESEVLNDCKGPEPPPLPSQLSESTSPIDIEDDLVQEQDDKSSTVDNAADSSTPPKSSSSTLKSRRVSASPNTDNKTMSTSSKMNSKPKRSSTVNEIITPSTIQQSTSSSSNSPTSIIMSASKLTAQAVSPNTAKDGSNTAAATTTNLSPRVDSVVASSSVMTSSMMSSSSSSSHSGSTNEPTITNEGASSAATKSISSISSQLSLLNDGTPIVNSLMLADRHSYSSPADVRSSRSVGSADKSLPQTPVSTSGSTKKITDSPSSIGPPITTMTNPQSNSSSGKKKTPTSGSKSSKKPWYSAFVNTYKQKNEDFRRLFKLPNEEHLLVDYSCALQREILAHGRLYVSLNYLCFRANIIGWETTLIIRMKDIRSIYKDKTAKIIPNAISVVLDQEKYFFTSFISRDKTYATVFRIWQIALADLSMSNDEIDTILTSCYGEDLGYNSDDADYEYYLKLKDGKSVITQDGAIFTTTAEFNQLTENRMNSIESATRDMLFSDTETAKTTNVVKFDTSSFSDDQSAPANRIVQSAKRKSTGASHHHHHHHQKHQLNAQQHENNTSSSSASSFAPYHHLPNVASMANYISNSGNTGGSGGVHHPIGHRQSSSFDTAMIDTSDTTTSNNYANNNGNENDDDERPRSMAAVVAGKSSHQKPFAPQATNMQIVLNSAIPPHMSSSTSSASTPSSAATVSASFSTLVPPTDLLNRSDLLNNTSTGDTSSIRDNETTKSSESSSPSPPATAVSNNLSSPGGITTSSPVVSNDRSDSSSSVDFDVNGGGEDSFSYESPPQSPNQQQQQPVATTSSQQIPASPEVLNVKCACGEHPGKEMLNQVYSLTVNYLWECLFGHTAFCRAYWESRKFGNIQVGEWKLVNSRPFRQLEYTVDLGGAIGRPKNIEEQKILEYRPNECIVLESESYTHGIPYSDYFSVRNRFCLTKVNATTTRLCIHSFLNFIKKPHFIAKNFIERNTMGALRDSYNYLDKNIPTVSPPANPSRLPAHISAISGEASSVINKSNTSSPANQAAKPGGGGSGGGGSRHNAKGENPPGGDLNGVSHTAKTAINNAATMSSQHHHQSLSLPNPTSGVVGGSNASPTTTTGDPIQQVTMRNMPGHAKGTKKRSSKHEGGHGVTSSHGGGHRMDGIMDMSPGSSGLMGGIHSQAQSSSPMSSSPPPPQFQTQLVPIQKFSFFKLEVNVDTLVRLFIVAMICLMVINAMLYYKLRRIESLADSIRSDPSLMTKVKIPDRQFESVLIESSKSATERESQDWRNLISKTLDAIEKMENSLRQWDKTLEGRENNQIGSSSTIAPNSLPPAQPPPSTSIPSGDGGGGGGEL